MSSDEIKMILQRLGSIETGIMNLGTRLEALENKVEERLQDTRPMWEGVQIQISQLRQEIPLQIERVREEVQIQISQLSEEVQQGFRFLNKKLELLVEDIVNVRTDQRLLERRVDDIEKRIPL